MVRILQIPNLRNVGCLLAALLVFTKTLAQVDYIPREQINENLEFYRARSFALGVSSNIDCNRAWVGGKNGPRLTTIGNYTPYTDQFYGIYSVGYDNFSSAVRGGWGVSFEHRSHMRESTGQVVYSPKFTAKDRFTIAPFVSYSLTSSPLLLVDGLKSSYALGVLMHSENTLAGADVEFSPLGNTILKSQLGRSKKFSENAKVSLLLHYVTGFEKYLPYMPLENISDGLSSEIVHSTGFNTITLVAKAQRRKLILGCGIGVERYTLERGEIRSDFQNERIAKPVVQLGYKIPSFEIMISTTGLLLSYSPKLNEEKRL